MTGIINHGYIFIYLIPITWLHSRFCMAVSLSDILLFCFFFILCFTVNVQSMEIVYLLKYVRCLSVKQRVLVI
jgi:hypothetical protein